MEFEPTRIIWHHSADASTTPQFEKIDAYHKTRGFPRSGLGYYVGYHYLIEHDGTVRQARRETEIGAHDQGENYDSIGICMAGHFGLNMPTEAQAEAAAELTDRLVKKWDISVFGIEPHRWKDTTDCPGRLLSDYWFVLNYLNRKVGWLKRLLIKTQFPKK